jgi:hypothetical protein
MRGHQRKVRIEAPVERVWAVLVDIERWHEWTASVTRIERLEDRPLGLGSRVRMEQPKLRPAVWTVTEWRPDSGFVWEARAPGVRTIGGHHLAAIDGGCEVTLDLRFDGGLGGVAGMLYGGLTERYVGFEAAGLKARAEDSAPT